MLWFLGLLMFGIGILAPAYGMQDMGAVALPVGKFLLILAVVKLVFDLLTKGSRGRA